VTIKEAKAIARALNCSLHSCDGEFRVNFFGADEASAYYTIDLDDAIDTAKAMFDWRELNRAGAK
jgi:hypothetical protein